MAQDHGLCRKKKESTNGSVHGPPLQARVAAGKPPALAEGDPGTHGMNRWQAKAQANEWTGAKQNERGQER